MEPRNLLRLKKVSIAYPNAPPILRDLTLEVNAGDILFVEGRNMSGKSTLARCLAGVLVEAYIAGSWLFSPKSLPSLRRMPLYNSRACGISFLPQDRPVFSSMSVADNILLLSSGGRELNVYARIAQFFDGLINYDQPICSLSGGAQLIVSFASIIEDDFSLLILDEPTAGLDASKRPALFDVIFERLSRQDGAALVIISHDPADFAHLARSSRAVRRLSMERGQVHEIQ